MHMIGLLKHTHTRAHDKGDKKHKLVKYTVEESEIKQTLSENLKICCKMGSVFSMDVHVIIMYIPQMDENRVI